MGLWKKFKDTAGKVADYTPGVSNIKGAIEGDWGQAAMGAVTEVYRDAKDAFGYGPTDYSELEESRRVAAQLRDAYMAEKTAPGYRPERIEAEQMGYADPGAAERYEAITPGEARTYEAVDPGAARTYEATQVEGPRDVQVGPLRPVEGVTAQQVQGPGDISEASFAQVGGAQIAAGPADKVRGQQEGYLAALERRARGEGPSVAEAAYSSKLDDVKRAALGVAGTARGSDKAYARLQALNQISDQTRRAGFEMAQLRADEIDKATGQLGGALSSVRGADEARAVAQAGFNQEASLQGQRVGAETSRFNAGARNAREEFRTGVAERGADRRLAADTATAGAINERTMTEAELRARTESGNVERTQGSREFNAGAETAAAAAAADAINRRESERAAAATAARADNTGAGNVRDSEIAAARTAAARDNTAATNVRQSERAAGAQDVAKFNAQQRQGASESNQSAGLQGAQVEEQRQQRVGNQTLEANRQVTDATNEKIAGAEANQAKSRQFLGNVVDVSTKVAAAASDKKFKEDIEPTPGGDLDRYADALARATADFKYKGDPEERTGQIANKLERSRIGKRVVEHRPDGRYINLDDYGLALGAVVGRLHRRLERLEGRG